MYLDFFWPNQTAQNSVVDLRTLYLDLDPEIFPNLDPDPGANLDPYPCRDTQSIIL